MLGMFEQCKEGQEENTFLSKEDWARGDGVSGAAYDKV